MGGGASTPAHFQQMMDAEASKPMDASDIVELNQAKAEISRFRIAIAQARMSAAQQQFQPQQQQYQLQQPARQSAPQSTKSIEILSLFYNITIIPLQFFQHSRRSVVTVIAK